MFDVMNGYNEGEIKSMLGSEKAWQSAKASLKKNEYFVFKGINFTKEGDRYYPQEEIRGAQNY